MMSPFVVFTFSNAEASAADENTHADRQTVALRIFQNVLENRKIGVEIEVVKFLKEHRRLFPNCSASWPSIVPILLQITLPGRNCRERLISVLEYKVCRNSH